MVISDEHLKQRALTRDRTCSSKGNSCSTTVRSSHCPAVELHYSRGYDCETSWGKFSFDPEVHSLLVLHQGTPPEELTPTAQVEDGHCHRPRRLCHDPARGHELRPGLPDPEPAGLGDPAPAQRNPESGRPSRSWSGSWMQADERQDPDHPHRQRLGHALRLFGDLGSRRASSWSPLRSSPPARSCSRRSRPPGQQQRQELPDRQDPG